MTTNDYRDTGKVVGLVPWLKRLLSGRPHFVIGGNDDPYLLRWYLIPRNRRLNIYLHKFLRSDDDRALHDHPWWFVSIIVWGRYDEIMYRSPSGATSDKGFVVRRSAPSIAFRHATHRHRVQLIDNRPCWTIIVTGRTSRTWGFWCPKGFVPWHKFVEQTDTGNVGRGCD